MTVHRFVLNRLTDPTGISGTGLVAEGAQFSDGRCVLRWLTAVSSIGVYDDLKAVKHIHGHGGDTEIVWIDD